MIHDATPADAEAIARVHAAAWAEAYAAILAPATVARWTVEERAARWRRILSGDLPDPHRAEVAVAEDAGRIMGFVSWGEPRDDGLRALPRTGEVSALYLLRAARGLRARGFQGLGLWVFSANAPARRFYERLGGRALQEQPFDMAGRTFLETAHAWDRLDVLDGTATPPR